MSLNTKGQEAYRSMVLSPFFKIGMLKEMPMGTIAGLKITELNQKQCKVTVPYKHINKNPFNTTYWAVLGMAAEMTSGALVQMYIHQLQPSVSMFVTNCTGKFIKRALGETTFICDEVEEIAAIIQKAIDTNKPQTIICTAKGYDKDGSLLTEFTFEWSLKARGK